MMRSIMAFGYSGLSTFRGGRREIVQRALHFGFGIDEEICACDNSFAFGETTLHFVVVADLLTQLDNTWLEFAAAFIDKGDLARAGRHHGTGRNGEAFAHVHAELDVRIHPRPQFEIGIRNIDAHLCGPLGLLEKWTNDRDLSFKVI